MMKHVVKGVLVGLSCLTLSINAEAAVMAPLSMVEEATYPLSACLIETLAFKNFHIEDEDEGVESTVVEIDLTEEPISTPESTIPPTEEPIVETPEPTPEPVVEEVIVTTDSSDLRLLSALIFAEAGNQCEAGQQAVGIIVMNRSASSSFANGVYNVIYESGQFTPTTNGALDSALYQYDCGSLPGSCIEAASYALAGNKTVYYNGYSYDLSGYYYFSRYLDSARLVIGEHMFK